MGRLHWLTMIGAAALVVHCGSKEDASTFDSEACRTTYAGKCGVQCKGEEDCAAGLHCQGGACTADCTAGQVCANQYACTPHGRCAVDDSTAISSDGGLACTNLCTKQVTCPNGGTTSLSGKVYDPAGKNVLYNVSVYVPNAPITPLQDGASCDRCGGTLSGSPLVTAITDASGAFKLTNVPVGQNIPLVIQVGKWRRQVTIPNVAKCADTPLDASITRLPKNKSEGDIPLIALTTGGADVMECLLRKVGLDDAEFTSNTGNGRVHFFVGAGNSATNKFDASHNAGANFPDAHSLWSTKASLMKYDIVLLSCEGATHPENKSDSLQALYDYTAAGGRVFGSHFHYYWFSTPNVGPATNPFEAAQIGTWSERKDPQSPADAVIDTSFPKGLALSSWMSNVGASVDVNGASTPGHFVLYEGRHNLDTAGTASQQWVTIQNQKVNNMTAVEYVSFNTPIPAPDDQKCGRVVYSDLHVSKGNGANPDQQGLPWPTGCKNPDLSAQEKALEFMLFDLSACIQNDHTEPKPPNIN